MKKQEYFSICFLFISVALKITSETYEGNFDNFFVMHTNFTGEAAHKIVHYSIILFVLSQNFEDNLRSFER